MSIEKLNIPVFIANDKYEPTTVSPRILFYNGVKNTVGWWINDSNTYSNITIYPYFDVYSGNIPNEDSKSLLFYNEESIIGTKPTESVYTQYWDKYISTLYNPKTRILEAKGIIPLTTYFNLVLNDIVEFKGNYYHLITINNYNVNTGECDLELLGPIIYDSLAIDVPITIELPTVAFINWESDGFNVYLNGNIISEGRASLSGVGFCYSTTNTNPTIDDSLLTSTNEIGEFQKMITVSDGVDYYFRVYATNQYGTSYSTVFNVNIYSSDILPNIQTLEPESITPNSAILKMNISSPGDSAITEAGWVWGLNPNPDITDNKLNITSFTNGVKSKQLTGLTNLKHYYIKAYAINSYGIVYGEEIDFVTPQKDYDVFIRVYNDSDFNAYEGVKVQMSKFIYDFPVEDQERIFYPSANYMEEEPLYSRVQFSEVFSVKATILGGGGQNIGFSQQYDKNSYASLATIIGLNEVVVDYMLYNYDGYVDNTYNPIVGQYPECGVSMNIMNDKGGSVMYINIYLYNNQPV